VGERVGANVNEARRLAGFVIDAAVRFAAVLDGILEFHESYSALD
jgi:hypothetical protein